MQTESNWTAEPTGGGNPTGRSPSGGANPLIPAALGLIVAAIVITILVF